MMYRERFSPRRFSLPLLGATLLSFAVITWAAPQTADLEQRIGQRDFPSVFQAWGAVERASGESELDAMARHDLVFHGPEKFGLRWNGTTAGESNGFTSASISAGQRYRAQLLRRNSNVVLLAELRYRGAFKDYLPNPSHPWWMKDENGNPVPGWADGPAGQPLTWQSADSWRLELRDESLQDSVAAKAEALMDSGVVDGVMLDWWDEGEFTDERLAIVQKIRAAIGDDAIIMVNSNERRIPLSAPFVNGMFMETGFDNSAAAWNENLSVLRWGQTNLRQPALMLYESWYRTSRDEVDLMRANATLSMVASDGYTLFAEPNTVVGTDHRHDWYPFWDVDLGKPIDQGEQRDDGSYQRNFTGGRVIYNPPENEVVELLFDDPVESAATGRRARGHSIAAFDGDILLFKQPAVAQEQVNNFTMSQRLSANARISIDIPYAANDGSDLVVSLQDTSNNWQTYGYARVPVSSGSYTAQVQLTVDATAPSGDGYAVSAYLVPTGKKWEQRLAQRTLGSLSVGP